MGFPELGWGVTQGDDLADAVKWAGRLLHDLMAHLIENNETLPSAKVRGRRMRAVAFGPLEQAKVECYAALRALGKRLVVAVENAV
ncbi:MAG: hypothetical protein IH602_11155 [Bryobacteraceae bacterium]|nr:hypothetical protein [Bryobacteraceae bacterium]